jgi:hypothetical protein
MNHWDGTMLMALMNYHDCVYAWSTGWDFSIATVHGIYYCVGYFIFIRKRWEQIYRNS